MHKNSNNSLRIRIIALIIGFSVNVFGNSLTVVSSEGAEPWTAAAVNLGKVTGASIGSFVILFGVINAIFNQIVLSRRKRRQLVYYREHERRIRHPQTRRQRSKFVSYELAQRFDFTFINKFRFVAELLYIFVFGYAIDWTVLILERIGLNRLNYPLRVIMSLIGVILFCSAISVYQRANIFMHPNDDTSNLIRFRFLKGSAFWSQIVDIIPALVICGICWPFLGTVYSISWGTAFSLLFNGIIIGLSDRWIWPSLIHNHQKKHTYQYSIWY